MFPSDALKMHSKKEYKKLHEFLVDSGNQLAYDIADRLVAGPGDSDYNPLFLFGPSGCGKTHLLEAIFQGISKSEQDFGILFFHAEEFHYLYTQAVRHKEFQAFRHSCRNCRAFLLDNLHLLQNKKNTQRELLFTVDELFDKGRLIIFSSLVKLKQLNGFNPALINRLESGLMIKLTPLSTKKAMSYFQNVADRFSFPLPQEMLESVLSEHEIPFGELRKNFEKLLMFCAANNQHLTRRILDGFMGRYYRKKLDRDSVLKAVGRHYRLDNWQKMCDKGGSRVLKEPRYLSMALVKELLHRSNEELREDFGGCSESAVRYALKKVRSEERLSETYRQLKEQLRESAVDTENL